LIATQEPWPGAPHSLSPSSFQPVGHCNVASQE
jgi:hypothetical protein